MPTGKRKGISAKIAEELYDEVKAYAESHEMTMSDFIERALQDALHPKFNEKEEITMEKTRTIAFQTSDEIFEKLNDYLHRHGLKKNKFFIDFITKVLEEDQAMQDKQKAEKEMAEAEEDEDMSEDITATEEEMSDEEAYEDMESEDEEITDDDVEDGEFYEDDETESEDFDDDESEDNSYSHGFDMSMSM